MKKLREQAEGGDAKAMYELGVHYQKGRKGLAKDQSTAFNVQVVQTSRRRQRTPRLGGCWVLPRQRRGRATECRARLGLDVPRRRHGLEPRRLQPWQMVQRRLARAATGQGAGCLLVRAGGEREAQPPDRRPRRAFRQPRARAAGQLLTGVHPVCGYRNGSTGAGFIVGSSTVKHKSYTRDVLTTLAPPDGLIDERITHLHSQRAHETGDQAPSSSHFSAGSRAHE